MFNRLKNRVLTAVSPDIPALPSNHSHHQLFNHNHHSRNLPDKFIYARPQFLQLMTYDELKASADHNVRPIIVPRDISIMPWFTGYAECVNSGKSEWNEDQAAFQRHVLSHPSKLFQGKFFLKDFFFLFNSSIVHQISHIFILVSLMVMLGTEQL